MKTKSGFDWPFFLKHIAIIAAPVALQNLLTTTGSMVDTMMLASLGGRGPVRPVLQPDVRGVLGLRGRGGCCSLLSIGEPGMRRASPAPMG